MQSFRFHSPNPDDYFKDYTDQFLTQHAKLGSSQDYREFVKKYAKLIELVKSQPLSAIQEGIETYDDFTPLIVAIDRNLEILANYILDLKPATDYINHQGPRNITALHVAAKQGQVDLAKRLIAMGANVDVSDDYSHSALHFAAMSGNSEMVELILSKCNPNEVNKETQFTNTALHLACESGNVESIRMILDKTDPKNINKTGENSQTPLYMAAKGGSLEGVKLLMSRIPSNDIDINQSNSFAKSLVHVAAASGNLDLVKFLQEKGAKLDNNHHEYYNSCLRAAILSKNPNLVRFICENEVDLDRVINDRKENLSALHDAVQTGSLEIVKILDAFGAQLNLKTGYDEISSLDVALLYGFDDIADFLKTKGVDTKYTPDEIEQFKSENLEQNSLEDDDTENHIDPGNNYHPEASVCNIM